MKIKLTIEQITENNNEKEFFPICEEYIDLDKERLNIYIDNKNIFSIGGEIVINEDN